MTTDSADLQEIVAAVAAAAGISSETVSLTENANGTFTLQIEGAERTGGLAAVLAWGFGVARHIARQRLENTSRPRMR